MTDPQPDARAAFADGLAHFEAGRLAPAEQAFRRALALAPGRPSVLRNLGLTLMHQSRWAEAEPLLQQASDADPADRSLPLALAECRCRLQDWAGAITAFDASGPPEQMTPEQLHGLAFAHLALRQAGAARALLDQALRAHPQAPRLHLLLADLLRGERDLAGARWHYRRAGESGADPELVRFYLAALDEGAVDRAPAGYVAALFDEYAQDFEQHLVGGLGYVAPRTLVDGLPAPPNGLWAHALDLGCGTGLCGELLRPICRRLDGVDLSPRMVERARTRGCYDGLAAADALDHLVADGPRHDLVVAVDVLIYIGALEGLMQALRRRLQPGGVFACSVESCDGAGLRLSPDLRFQHSRLYLERVATEAGLSMLRFSPGLVRVEQEQPVEGAFVYLQAPA